MKQFALVIENELCWGCLACEVACKQENGTSTGVKRISVTESWSAGKEGTPRFLFQVNLCRHCDDPPCAAACPEEVIQKKENGIVVLNEADCIGCQSCIDACPYGAIGFDAKSGVAQKCNLCHHRVAHGLIPACADNVCLAHCIRFVENI